MTEALPRNLRRALLCCWGYHFHCTRTMSANSTQITIQGLQKLRNLSQFIVLSSLRRQSAPESFIPYAVAMLHIFFVHLAMEHRRQQVAVGRYQESRQMGEETEQQ